MIKMNTKIMVVDDEPDVLDSLKSILEHENYEVITVKSGSECLKKLEDGFEGIIFMDILMPEMDGWDTIKEIVDRGYIRNVAINIVSGIGYKEHQQMGILEPYIYDFLSKPVEIRELIKSVEKSNIFLQAKNK
ncbi:MAG: response regulator [Thermoplasmatales archaeon]|nr:response regulator [Thermoplasmatales archaeon]